MSKENFIENKKLLYIDKLRWNKKSNEDLKLLK